MDIYMRKKKVLRGRGKKREERNLQSWNSTAAREVLLPAVLLKPDAQHSHQVLSYATAINNVGKGSTFSSSCNTVEYELEKKIKPQMEPYTRLRAH